MRSKNIEKNYPLIISGFVGLLMLINTDVTSISIQLEKILDASITFSSIIIGFLSALLGIIFSIKNTEIIDSILNYDYTRETFVEYFKKSIISGFFTIMLSSVLFLDELIPNIKIEKINYEIMLLKYLFILWCAVLTYFILSSYRIIDILMIVILDKSNTTHKELKGEQLNEDEVKKLKEELNKNKNVDI